MKVQRHKKWKNWSGYIQCKPKNIFYPTTEQEIVDIVKRSAENNQKVRVVGSGHSFSPLIATNDNIICLNNYSGIEKIDTDKKQAIVKSGTRLRNLGAALAEQSLAMENLGDIDRQTISGVVGTGTHGTGLHLGNISTQVVKLRIVTGNGEIIECSEEENSEIFKAALVSVGSLGIISTLQLRLVPLYHLKVTKKREHVDECIRNLQQNFEKYRHYEFFIFPYSDIVYTKSSEVTEKEAKVGMLKKYISDVILENIGLWFMKVLARLFPRQPSKIAKFATKCIPEGEEIDLSYRIFTSYRWVRFQEMEYAVPIENGIHALREVLEWIRQHKFPVHFPIEYRCVKEDDIYLSPAHGRNVVYIALHTYKDMPYREYFEECEKIFRKWGGRPHWGKMNFLKSSDFKEIYPKWDEFCSIRERLDPKETFLNDYLKEIFGNRESVQ